MDRLQPPLALPLQKKSLVAKGLEHPGWIPKASRIDQGRQPGFADRMKPLSQGF
jgi:hypothetical protein